MRKIITDAIITKKCKSIQERRTVRKFYYRKFKLMICYKFKFDIQKLSNYMKGW